MLGQTQLGKGAEHAVGLFTAKLAFGDVNAAGKVRVVQSSGDQIAFMDILGTGDDLNRLFFAHIHLADPHMVGILVADDGEHLAYLDVFNFCVHALPGLHLLTEDRELFDVFFIGNVGKIHEFLMQPFSVEFH